MGDEVANGISGAFRNVFGNQSTDPTSSCLNYEKQRMQYPEKWGGWGEEFSVGPLC